MSLRIDAPSFTRLPRYLTGLCSLCLTVASATATAADVWIVTDQHHPVTAFPGARVIELDAPARAETELAAGLPTDPHRAATVARDRLAQGGSTFQRRLASAYQDVLDAWRLGVAKIPAVIVDRRYVVYGEPNAARAIERIEAYRNSRP